MTRIRTLPYDRKIGAAGAAPICIENSPDALKDHLPVQGIPAGPSRTCRLYQGARRRLTAPGEIASLAGVRIRVGLILTWAVTRRCQGDGLGGTPCGSPSTSATAAGSSGARPPSRLRPYNQGSPVPFPAGPQPIRPDQGAAIWR